MTDAAGALDGMRVVDLSTYLPGPYATMLLADLGADVLHVEQPGGEPARHLPERMGEDSVLHWWVSRNKRSVELDLKDPLDRATLLEHVRQADVVVEGFRPGVATRLGVDYEACRAVNDRIVYCALTAYGQAGPHARDPGHDLNYSAKAGLLGLTTDRAGAPALIGFPVSDVAGGLHATVGILAAYLHQQRTGEGQYVDVSILGSALGMAGLQLMKSLAGAPPVPETDLNLGGDPAYGLYRCRDGRWLSIGCVEPKFWRRLCQLVRREDLSDRRESEPEEVRAELVALFLRSDLAVWDDLFEGEEVCYAPVLDITEVAAEARESGVVADLAADDGSAYPVLLTPIQMSVTPLRLRHRAPRLAAPART